MVSDTEVNVIANFGLTNFRQELEIVLKKGLTPEQKKLMGLALELGYFTGMCETSSEYNNKPEKVQYFKSIYNTIKEKLK